MSNLDLLNDLDIALLAASEPDLKTLAAQGDGASMATKTLWRDAGFTSCR